MSTTNEVLPSPFIKGAAKIDAAQEAERQGHCNLFGWHYLLIIALVPLIWLAAGRTPILLILLILLLALVVVRTIVRYRSWVNAQRIDNPQSQEIIVVKAFKIRSHPDDINSSRSDYFRNGTVGLRFDDEIENSKKVVFVSNISEDSPFQRSLLRIGMQILSVNREKPETGLEAHAMVQQVEEGHYVKLTAVVSPTTHERTKKLIGYNPPPQEEERQTANNTGLRGQQNKDSSTRGKKEDDKKRGRTKHIRINEDPTRFSSSSDATEDEESRRASNNSVEEGPPVKVKVHKRMSKTPLGLSLLRTPEGKFKVSAIEPGSKFDATGLSIGMIVEKINGTEVSGLDSPSVMRKLYNSVGDIEVEARALDMVCSKCTTTVGGSNPSTRPGYGDDEEKGSPQEEEVETTTTTLTRQEEEDDLGINLVRDSSTGKYYVRDWPNGDNEDEEMQGTTDTETALLGVHSGMQLLAVNGVTVAGKPIEVVLSLLRKEKAEDVELTLSCEGDDHVDAVPTTNAMDAGVDI